MKFLVILSVFLISACGMQGNLYLPEDKPAQDKPAQDKPAQERSAQDEVAPDDTIKENSEGSK